MIRFIDCTSIDGTPQCAFWDTKYGFLTFRTEVGGHRWEEPLLTQSECDAENTLAFSGAAGVPMEAIRALVPSGFWEGKTHEPVVLLAPAGAHVVSVQQVGDQARLFCNGWGFASWPVDVEVYNTGEKGWGYAAECARVLHKALTEGSAALAPREHGC